MNCRMWQFPLTRGDWRGCAVARGVSVSAVGILVLSPNGILSLCLCLSFPVYKMNVIIHDVVMRSRVGKWVKIILCTLR